MGQFDTLDALHTTRVGEALEHEARMPGAEVPRRSDESQWPVARAVSEVPPSARRGELDRRVEDSTQRLMQPPIVRAQAGMS